MQQIADLRCTLTSASSPGTNPRLPVGSSRPISQPLQAAIVVTHVSGMNCHPSLGNGAAGGLEVPRAELGNTVTELLQQAKQNGAISIGVESGQLGIRK